MAKDKGKVKFIVEETVQHVYLLDPEDKTTIEAFHAFPQLVTEQAFESIPMSWDKPPATLGHRAKKAAAMPRMLLNDMKAKSEGGVDTYSRMSSVTMVIPDEEGHPAVEIKVTKNNVVRKPVTK